MWLRKVGAEDLLLCGPFPMMCSAAGARKLLLGARLVTSVRETGRSELDRPTLRPWMDMAYARGWR
jgi:hypothetical protein